MRNVMIGAAALALAATGAWADPGGKGNGGGNGGGKGGDHAAHGPSMKAERGGDRGPSMKMDRGPEREAKADRGPSMRAEKQERREWAKSEDRPERRVERDGRDKDRWDDDDRMEQRDGRWAGRDRDRWDDDDDDDGMEFGRSRGLIDGCPPGLAKKNNGCTPPGLAKDRDGYRSAYDPSYFGYRSLGDGRYYVDNGYMYRVNNSGSILGYVPLLGGALSPGQMWPSYYQPVSVPNYYVDYYNLGPANGYRYADNVLYRVDPQSSTINSIAALLTGDQWAVGQPMPMGYDVYNVPYAYQDRYRDSADSYYRYSDGYVYQVDPTTQLVQAVIELLV